MERRRIDRATSVQMALVLTSLASDLIFHHSDNDMESTWGNLNPEQDKLRTAFRTVSQAKMELEKYIHEYQPGLDIRPLVSQVEEALNPYFDVKRQEKYDYYGI